jgi:tRNA nucleotidyltransferase/poly(A) polymerase
MSHSPIPNPQSLIPNILAFIAARGVRAWLVGGYVRDQLSKIPVRGLGQPSHDLDLIVPEGGIALARAIANAFGGGFFVLDRERDVARAVLRDEAGEVLDVDVARLRAPDLLGDLALRDFTVNAIAVEIGAGEVPGTLPVRVFDPFDGRADLARGVIRAVAEHAFRDDPLRTLRAVRQAAELGFCIEDATASLIRRDAALLAAVSAERVRDELGRIVVAPGAWQHVCLLADLGLLRVVLPEAAALIGVAQTYPHYQDVFDHTRAVLAHTEGLAALLWPAGPYARPEPVAGDATIIASAGQWAEVADALAPYAADLRAHLTQPLASGHTRRDGLFWAALAHDWGKPATSTTGPDGRIHFYEHERVGATMAEARGRALKFAADEVAYLRLMVDQHMRPSHLAKEYPPGRRALYHYFRDVGDAGPDCALLSLADHLAFWAAQPVPEHPGPTGGAGAGWPRRLGTFELILETYFRQHEAAVAPRPLLDGRQIMAEFGLKPGPQVGRLLEGLREEQAAGAVATIDQAREWLRARVTAG